MSILVGVYKKCLFSAIKHPYTASNLRYNDPQIFHKFVDLLTNAFLIAILYCKIISSLKILIVFAGTFLSCKTNNQFFTMIESIQ